MRFPRFDGHLPCGREPGWECPCLDLVIVGLVDGSRRSSRPTRCAWWRSRAGRSRRSAKELGIYDSSLGNWVREARAEAEGAPTAAERAEIRELKRELERVTRERDILGKATAYFSARDPRNG